MKKPALSAPSWPADKVERRPVSSLIAYARNARLHSPEQVSAIAASITEFGWTVPALIDESGVLIAGHGRVLAAKQLGLDSIPVMIARNWTEAQIRAYRIADNQLALNSAWDNSLLKFEIGQIQALNFNVDLLGFDQKTMVSFLASNNPDAPDGFKAFDENLETEHECPKCRYRWSGSSAPICGGGPIVSLAEPQRQSTQPVRSSGAISMTIRCSRSARRERAIPLRANTGSRTIPKCSS